MVCCCVPFCKSKHEKGRGLSFHRFPRDDELKKIWCIAISRQGEKRGSLWTPNSKSVICSKHFKESDFSISTSIKCLLPKVVPSVFEDYPIHKKRVQPKCRSKRKRNIELGSGNPIKKVKLDVPMRKDHLNVSSTSNVTSGATNASDVTFNYTSVAPSKSNATFNYTAFASTASNVTFNYTSTAPSTSDSAFNDTSIVEPLQKTVSTQCSFVQRNAIPESVKIRHKKTARKCRKQMQVITRLRNIIHDLKQELSIAEKQNKENQQVNRIKEAAEEGSLRATFLIEQIESFGKQKCSFHENTYNICKLLFSTSSTGYKMLRNLGVLHLPHHTTLYNHVARSKEETEVSSAGASLNEEAHCLTLQSHVDHSKEETEVSSAGASPNEEVHCITLQSHVNHCKEETDLSSAGARPNEVQHITIQGHVDHFKEEMDIISSSGASLYEEAVYLEYEPQENEDEVYLEYETQEVESVITDEMTIKPS